MTDADRLRALAQEQRECVLRQPADPPDGAPHA